MSSMTIMFTPELPINWTALPRIVFADKFWYVLLIAVVVEESHYILDRSPIMLAGTKFITASHSESGRTPCLQAFVPSENIIKSLKSAKFGRKDVVSRFWHDVASTAYHKANSHVHWFFCLMKSHSIELSCTRPRVSSVPHFPTASPAIDIFCPCQVFFDTFLRIHASM